RGASGDTTSVISEATSASLTVQNPSAISSSYWVRVSNTYGSSDSQSATVSIDTSVTVKTTGQLSAVSPAVFVITRDITATRPLTVSVNLGGSALPGSDYLITGATLANGSYHAVIPVSSPSMSVTISLLSGATVGRTVDLSLATDPTYAIGQPASASLAIQPMISVSASGSPSRSGPNPGTFTLTCAGCQSLGAPLNVGFNLGGSATNGSDYTLAGLSGGYTPGTNGGSVTFTAQNPSISLTMTPTGSSQYGQSISLTVPQGIGYGVGSPMSAELVIDGDPPPPWLVLLYLAGDDVAPNSTQVSLTDYLNPLLQRLPYNRNMRLVVLYDGNVEGDSAIYVREQYGLRNVTSEVRGSGLWQGSFPSNNELDTGSVMTLQNFIRWARTTYPGSSHTMLSIIDHGGGWSPAIENANQRRGGHRAQSDDFRGLSSDRLSGNALSTRDTGATLASLGAQGRFDVIFYDACLMGMIESAYEIKDYTNYLVAGENLLWSAFPYENYFDPSRFTKTISPRALASMIVDQYNEPIPHDAQGVATEPFAIAAIDATKLLTLTLQTRQLASDLLAAMPAAEGAIRSSYAQAQKFDYDASLSLDPSDGYVDLGHLAQLLATANLSPTISRDAQTVADTLTQQVIVGKPKVVSGSYRDLPVWDFHNASGLSIYMPIGERDCRPTGRLRQVGDPGALAPCIAPQAAVGDPLVEWQLGYYARPQQLHFINDAPEWAALLIQLDPRTPARITGDYNPPMPLTGMTQIYLPMLMK
ncbi:MAG: clostripain-related cysteine peptidase, partial [Chloroflexales bacterium]